LAGRGDFLPAYIKIVGIPAFENVTDRPELGKGRLESLLGLGGEDIGDPVVARKTHREPEQDVAHDVTRAGDTGSKLRSCPHELDPSVSKRVLLSRHPARRRVVIHITLASGDRNHKYLSRSAGRVTIQTV
jgi:hypothetical protein